MQIIMKNRRRVLIKESEYENEVEVEDGDIIEYQGIY